MVLYKIASELSIPFDIKGDSGEVVDLDINKSSLEDAVLRMSPNVRLYVRVDLRTTGKKTVSDGTGGAQGILVAHRRIHFMRTG